MRRLFACACLLVAAPLVNACAAQTGDDANGANDLTGPIDSADAGNTKPDSMSGEDSASHPASGDDAASSSPPMLGEDSADSSAPDATACVPGASCTFPSGEPGAIVCSGGVATCQVSCPTGCYTGGSGTPLVLAFDRRDVRFTDAEGTFDVFGLSAGAPSATPIATRWVSAETPWLALDRNGNGRIDDGSELFGSMTEVPGGGTAANGFAALAPLDSDGDGKITAHDARYGDLLLWRDFNQDRVSQPGELTRLADEGIESIDLAYEVDALCVDGDCEVERGRALLREGTLSSGVNAAVIDVHFAARVGEPALR